MADKPPSIVAELGRAETPDETAARRAATSRRHRSSQTVVNLVASIAASLLAVLFLVLVVVRPDPPDPVPVDFEQVAERAESGSGVALASPEVPESWRANAATLETVRGVETWYIGLITGGDQFIALNQGISADESWLVDLIGNAEETDRESLGGVEWTVFDRRQTDDPGNLAYAMVASTDRSTIVLNGTASDAEFRLLASAVAADLENGSDR